METSEIKSILMKDLDLDEIYVSGDTSHFHIIAVSAEFADMSLVKKQQTIYRPLMQYIENNRIHALSIQAYSLKEWKHNCKLHKNIAFKKKKSLPLSECDG